MSELGPNIDNVPVADPLKRAGEPLTSEDIGPIYRAIFGTQRSIKRLWDYLSPFSRYEIVDRDGRVFEVLAKPVGLRETEDLGPLTIYRKDDDKLGIRFGVVNSLIPDNIDDGWDSLDTDTYFFMQASLQNSRSRLVTNAHIVTGSSPSSYGTADFSSGNPPSQAYFPLGYASNSEIVNAGRGNLEFHVITSRMYSTSELHVDYRIAIYRTG